MTLQKKLASARCRLQCPDPDILAVEGGNSGAVSETGRPEVLAQRKYHTRPGKALHLHGLETMAPLRDSVQRAASTKRICSKLVA